MAVIVICFQNNSNLMPPTFIAIGIAKEFLLITKLCMISVNRRQIVFKDKCSFECWALIRSKILKGFVFII